MHYPPSCYVESLWWFADRGEGSGSEGNAGSYDAGGAIRVTDGEIEYGFGSKVLANYECLIINHDQ